MEKERLIKIKIDNLLFGYSNNQKSLIFNDLSLQIYENEVVTILGRSGCGKTTLLNLIVGDLTPNAGIVEVNNQSKVSFSLMPQTSIFIPFRTSFENAALPIELINNFDTETLNKLKQLFIVFGLSGYENKFPSELSGGMKQRLGLIQNFATDTQLRIFDEPLNALDYTSVVNLTDTVWNKLKTKKETGIFVTHDIEFAVSVSDRLIILKGYDSGFSEINMSAEIAQTIPSKRKTIAGFKEISNKVVTELLN